MNTFAEFYSDTNPNDAGSKLALTIMERSPGGDVLHWQSRPDKTYSLRGTSGLNQPFSLLLDSGILATPPVNVYSNLPASELQMFYRIEIE
jgi:hypothetical protein